MAPTLQQKAQMQAAQTTALEQLQKAEAWALVTEASFWVTDAQRASLKAIKDTRSLYTTWSTTWRSWAELGTTPTGEPYSVDFWLRIGGDFVSAIKTYAGGLYDASVFAVVAGATKETLKDLGKAGQAALEVVTEPWATSTKLALAGAGVLLVLVVAGVASQTLPGRLVREALKAAT
jgi:hypothetical protein